MNRSFPTVLIVVALAASWSPSSYSPDSGPQDPRRRVPVVTKKAALTTEQRVLKLEQELAKLRAVLQVQQTGSKKSLVVKVENFSVDASGDVTLEAGDDVRLTAKDDTLHESGDRFGFEVDGDVVMKSARDLSLESGTNLRLRAGANAELRANANATVRGNSRLDLRGALIVLNNGKRAIARQADTVTGMCPPAGPLTGGKIVAGSPTVVVP